MMTQPSGLYRKLGIVATALVLVAVGGWMLIKTPAPVKAATTLGSPLPNLTSLETTMFNGGLTEFNKTWDPTQGLGPVFTQFRCALCHSDPGVVGGNSKLGVTFVGKYNSDGSYTDLVNEGGPQIQPQSNQQFKSQCNLKGEVVPNDATIVATHQTPQTLGLGLIDNIPDSQILAQAVPKPFGVQGVANMIVDENGTLRVGRFGLKSQQATLTQMSANALLHELGVTNPIFMTEDLPQGLPIPPFCSIKNQPNDPLGPNMIDAYHYLLYLAPNTPGTGNANGQSLFTSVGCSECHNPTYTTATKVNVMVTWKGRIINSNALANQQVNLYSDLLLHDLGGLNGDGLEVGISSGTQFRTAPLWGLSTRITAGNGFLHDGSAKDVMSAIEAHSGEASQIVSKFNGLKASDQADLIAFISSL